jgi:hypothetical protein
MVELNSFSDDPNNPSDEGTLAGAPNPNAENSFNANDPFCVHRRDEQDDETPNPENIIVGCNDVLLGRGKGMETHLGNQMFQRMLVESL